MRRMQQFIAGNSVLRFATVEHRETIFRVFAVVVVVVPERVLAWHGKDRGA